MKAIGRVDKMTYPMAFCFKSLPCYWQIRCTVVVWIQNGLSYSWYSISYVFFPVIRIVSWLMIRLRQPRMSG